MINPEDIDTDELLETVRRLGASSGDELALRTGHSKAEITPALDLMVDSKLLRQRRIKGRAQQETVVYLPGTNTSAGY